MQPVFSSSVIAGRQRAFVGSSGSASVRGMWAGVLPVAFLAAWLIAVTASADESQPAVRLEHEAVTLPTYRIGPAEPNPIFYRGRRYQGAQGRIYPYPLLDRLTDDREDRTYDGVVLENAYVRICVLPEIGGRILSGTDKTNGYEFFYRQHSIKPALIGMAGAWISGGVEWNVPHHHRASTYMPVDYRLVENADGSKTLWVGETELRHRMRWLVGLTLRPDRSYLTTTVKLFNGTPLPNSMLYFANVAVHANPNYQVIFPPGTQFGTQHAKQEFVHWPIGRERYASVDYNGVDVSWWKNHPKPVSIFAWNDRDDFFGGYDHGRHAGVVQVADHHTSPGKKFFEWGSGPDAAMWDKVLTDADGPYLELMSGAWSDNQPDYSWVHPYETRIVDQYWYPVRELAGVKQANLDAALNLDVHDGRARLALNATGRFPGARAALRLADTVLLQRTIDIAPDAPWAEEVALPAGARQTDLVATLTAADGRELIRYQPQTPAEEPMPPAVTPVPPPAEIKTVEELYLAGLRLEQFHNPVLHAEDYYREALRRDPDDTRVNTAMGILACRRGEVAEAEQYLQKALARVTRNYTRPLDGSASYYLGLVQRAQGNEAEAARSFQRAAWSYAWRTASHYQLAELACRRGAWAEALQQVSQSLATQAECTQALALQAAILRHSGHPEEAAAVCRRAMKLDPLDFRAGREWMLARAAQGGPADDVPPLADLMRGEVQSYLELAVGYAGAGLWDEAIAVLDEYVALCRGRAVYPMVHYYLGYFHGQKGRADERLAQYRLGRQAPPDYCFPHRLEAMAVLRDAMKADPTDPRAPYYLGNLLYDLQPREAIAAWERSRELDGSFATVHRNLGVAYAHTQGDPAKAVASYEKAVACNPGDPRVYAELDENYRLVGEDPARRLALLETHHDVVATHTDSLTREVVLNVLVGRYDRAIALLETHHFRRWEGEMGLHDVFVEAHLLRGQARLKENRNEEALADFEAAQTYPDNLEVGRPKDGKESDAKANYLAAVALQRLGRADEAQSRFAQAAGSGAGSPEARFYRGLAHRKRGEEDRAKELFDGLVRSGRDTLAAGGSDDFFAKFGGQQTPAMRQAGGHFQIGLGLAGQGDAQGARRALQQAVQLDVDHLGARGHLAFPDVSEGADGKP